MTSPTEKPRSVAVIGGGITGLAAAHRLHELDPSVRVTLFEASDRPGGVLQTVRDDAYLLELSADNFITNVPWALDLCRRIGLAEELLETRASERRAFVVHRGKLEAVPEGFLLMAPGKIWPIVSTPILSLRGKLRLLGDWFIRPRENNRDESLASFVTRRLGRETFERLVQPLVGGIYTADPEKLSLAATMPRFLEMERRHGSLIRAALKEQSKKAGPAGSGARYSMFVAPREGMASLVTRLVERLPTDAIRFNSPVTRIAPRSSDGWLVTVDHEAPQPFDAVVLAAPALCAAEIVKDTSPELAHELRAIPYAGSAVALLGYRRDQLAKPLEGFGFVVPDVERRSILATSFSSQKFDGRAPSDHVLLRVFLGGAAHPEMVDLPDDELKRIAQRELGELLGARGEPSLFRVVRWAGRMPQYHLGHLDRVERIEALAVKLPGLQLAGNAYHGVGIPNCIHSGEQAAERLLRIDAG